MGVLEDQAQLTNDKVLLVDDDPVLLRANVWAFRSAGYDVLEATTGSDALAMSRAHQPDLILLDVVLPDLDGTAVCQAIRSDPALSGTMILMLSGQRMESSQRVDGLDCGADAYLIKPIPLRELLAWARTALRIRHMHSALHQAQADLERQVEVRTAQLVQTNAELRAMMAEREQAEKMLRVQRDLGIALGSTSDQMLACRCILDAAMEVEGIDAGGVYLVNSQTGDVDLVVHHNLPDWFVAGVGHYTADSHNAQLLLAGKPIYTRASLGVTDSSAHLKREQLRAIVVIPVWHHGRVIAALNLASHDRDELPEATRLALAAIANQIGTVIARIRADEAIKNERENLRMLFDVLDDYLFVADGAAQLLHLNTSLLRRLGYTHDELVGQPVWLMYASERRADVEHNLADMITGRARSCPIPLRTKDGALIPVESGTALGRWNGQPALFGIARDITERQLAENELRVSKERYRIVADCTYDWEYWQAPDGQMVYVSPSCERLTGYRADAFLADKELMARLIHPDDLSTWRDHVKNLDARGDVLPVDFRITRRDGAIRWIAHVCQPVHSASGEWLGRRGSNRDITERKQMEDRLVKHAVLADATNQIAELMLKTLNWEQVITLALGLLGEAAGVDRVYLFQNLHESDGLIRAKCFHVWCAPGSEILGDSSDTHAIFWGWISLDDMQATFGRDRIMSAHVRNLPDSAREILQMRQVKSVLGVPIIMDEVWWGMIGFGECACERDWTDAEIHAVKIAGNILAAAVKRNQVEESLQQIMHSVTVRMATVQEAERRRLAGELHDRVGQNLAALGINLKIVRGQLPPNLEASISPRLDMSSRLLEETVEHVRDVVAELRPAVLDDYGLMAALQWYSQRFAYFTGIQVVAEGKELAPRLSHAVEVTLFRIAQEALTNVAKHAVAKQVIVRLDEAGPQARLWIADDGVGFDTTAAGRLGGSGGLGLTTMAERAAAIGGVWQLESAPGKGTHIAIEVPR